MTTFAELGLSEKLVAALAEQGIETPFAIQSLTIADALAGRDVCGKAKTGSGKTLAFGLPILDRIDGGARGGFPQALVLAPTRELAVQIHDVLVPYTEAVGLRLHACYGGTSVNRDIQAVRKGVDVLVATPGRLIDLGNQGEVTLDDLAVLVLDEADRMADMGFMPQVEWVLRRLKHPHQTLLFSATLDRDVDHLVSRYMNDPAIHEVVSDQPTVEAMEHRFLKVHQMDKPKVAAAISKNVYRTMFFVRTKRGADRLVDQLKKEGVRAGAIHGDLRQNVRQRSLDKFSSGDLPALVATDVAARGLHIDDVDIVVHYDPAEDHKSYLHRSGRTARAGSTGIAVTLMLWDQELEVERMRRRLGLEGKVIEVFSNDPRLSDLSSIEN